MPQKKDIRPIIIETAYLEQLLNFDDKTHIIDISKSKRKGEDHIIELTVEYE